MITVLAFTTLLMVFSVISWILGNSTLAAVAGTAACTLAGDVVRRLLDMGKGGGGPGPHDAVAAPAAPAEILADDGAQ